MDKKQTSEPAYLNLFKIKSDLKTTNTQLAEDEKAKFLAFKKQLEEILPVQLTELTYDESFVTMHFNENIVDGKLLIFPLLLELEKIKEKEDLKLDLHLNQNDKSHNVVMKIKFSDLKLEFLSKPAFAYDNIKGFEPKTVFSYNKLEYIFS